MFKKLNSLSKTERNLITEGMAKIELGEAFYNPKMESCRDLSVLLQGELGEVSVCDGFAATGMRGIRYKLECPNVKKVTFVEVNAAVAKICRKNAKSNKIKANVVNKDIREFLQDKQIKFDVIDLDPFGTPAIYIYDAISALSRNKESSYLFATATDTAVLCGAHRHACQKTYNAASLNTSFCHELGIRILLGFIARIAAQFNLGMVPLLSYSHGHFMRVHVKLLRGDVHAYPSVSQMGYTYYCPDCHVIRSFFANDKVKLGGICKDCKWTLLGPLWLGQLHDNQMLLALAKKSADYKELFSTMLKENPFLYYYDMHELAGRLKKSPGKIEAVIHKIRIRGYDASRTHFSPLGIKTNMPLKELEEMV